MSEIIIRDGFLAPEYSRTLAHFEKEIKALKDAEEKLKAEILAAMEANGCIKLETPELNITYIAPTDRETFDSKAFRAEHPEMYDDYVKMSAVKSSIRIKVK